MPVGDYTPGGPVPHCTAENKRVSVVWIHRAFVDLISTTLLFVNNGIITKRERVCVCEKDVDR